jgi:hypothetical protein
MVFKKSSRIVNHPVLSTAMNSTGLNITLEMPGANTTPLISQGDIGQITEDGGDGSILYTGIVEDFPDTIDQTVDYQLILTPIGVELADTPFTQNYTVATDVSQMIRDAVAATIHCIANTSTVPNSGITGIYNFVEMHPLDVLQTAAKIAGVNYVWSVNEIGQVFFGAIASGTKYTVRTRVDAAVRQFTAPITDTKNYVKGYGAIPSGGTAPIFAIYDQTAGSPYGKRALSPSPQFPNLTDQTTLNNIVNTIGAALNQPLVTVVLKFPFHNDNGTGIRFTLGQVGGASIQYWEPSQDDVQETEVGLGTLSPSYVIMQVDVDGIEQTVTARSIALSVDDFVNEINNNNLRLAGSTSSFAGYPVTPGQVAGSTSGGPNTPSAPAWAFSFWSTAIDNIAQVANAYVIVKWTPNASNENVSQYEIRYSKAADGNYFTEVGLITLTDGGGRGYKKISGLIQGQSYTFEIRAINNLGIPSAWSSTQAITTALDVSVPAVPTGINAGTTPRGAIVTWDANVEPDLQGYQLQVSIAGAAYINVGAISRSTIVTYVAPHGTPAGTSLQFKVQAADNSGNLSGYSAASTAVLTDSINNPDILAGSVTADKIAANAITADKLAATLVLASIIKAGLGTQRVEISQNGLVAYDASGNIVVNIPNDGSPVTVNAQLIGKSLDVTGNAILRGTLNELALGSITQLDSSQGNPTQFPALAATWDSVSFPVDGTYDFDSTHYTRVGLDYDAAGGAGGATKVLWVATQKSNGSNEYLLELKASDRTVNRSINVGAGGTSGKTPLGVCRLGSYVYELYRDQTGSGGSGNVGHTGAATASNNFAIGTTQNWIATGPFTMTEHGTITSISAYMGSHSVTTDQTLCLWDGSGTLQGSGVISSCPVGLALRTVSISPVDAPSGSAWYVGFISAFAGDRVWGIDSSGQYYWKSSQATPTTPTSGATTATPGYIQCYATYTKFVTAWKVDRYLQSTLAFDVSYGAVSFPVAAPNNPVICQDGTNIYIVDFDSSIKWNKYDATMAKVGSTIDTVYSSGVTPTAVSAGSFDFGAFRIAVASNTIDTFDSTGARQTNESFPFSSSRAVGITYGDALGDGARFWSLPLTANSTALNLTKHSVWTWTTASSIYWVACSWYDSAGTVHETTVGPRGSITMGRRQQLTITFSPIPGAGGADDPNNIRFYMIPNATDPGVGGLKLQATQPGTTLIAVTYASGGAADPGSNNFPGGGPANLKSQTSPAGWFLKGDGTSSFMQLFDEQTIASSSGYVSPTLPTNFRHIEIRYRLQSDSNTTLQEIAIRMNADTGSHYMTERMQAGGTGNAIANEVATATGYAGQVYISGITSGAPSTGRIYFPGWLYFSGAVLTWRTSWDCYETSSAPPQAGKLLVGETVGAWWNNQQVSTITILPVAGTFSGIVSLFILP